MVRLELGFTRTQRVSGQANSLYCENSFSQIAKICACLSKIVYAFMPLCDFTGQSRCYARSICAINSTKWRV